MNDNELYAKALVECGYAGGIGIFLGRMAVIVDETYGFHKEIVDPFAKTKEGYEQAFALEDWLATEHGKIWGKSADYVEFKIHWHYHQWRCDRIKWCFEQPEIAEALK